MKFSIQFEGGLPPTADNLEIGLLGGKLHLAIHAALNAAGNRRVSGLFTDLNNQEVPIRISNGEYIAPPPAKKGAKLKPAKPVAATLCHLYQTLYAGNTCGQAEITAAKMIGYEEGRSIRHTRAKGRTFLNQWGAGPCFVGVHEDRPIALIFHNTAIVSVADCALVIEGRCWQWREGDRAASHNLLRFDAVLESPLSATEIADRLLPDQN